MEGIENQLTFVLSLVAAINHFYLSLLGLGSGRGLRAVNGTFSALAFVAGWYALWVGLVFSGILGEHPQLIATSQLFSGYFGPILVLFALASLNPVGHLPRRYWWLLVLGLFGTIIALRTILGGPEYGAALLERFKGGSPWLDPLGGVLFFGHMLENLACLAATFFLVGRALWRRPGPVVRRRAIWVLVPTVCGLLAVGASNVLPTLLPSMEATRFGPILTIPAVLLAYKSLVNSRQELLDAETHRQHLGRYLPTAVVERVLAGEGGEAMPGGQTVATVLMADIRDFTALTESTPPDRVVALLDRYYSVMNRVVFEHGGMVNKFIGDAVLAVFGLYDDEETDARRALDCTAAMHLALEEVNATWIEEGHAPIAIGIALHRGALIHGNVGSDERMEYAVIGDAVNVAARVEALNKSLGTRTLVTGEVVDALGAEAVLVPKGEQILRGRSSATRLYTPEGAERLATRTVA